jgi:hypothetical protein
LANESIVRRRRSHSLYLSGLRKAVNVVRHSKVTPKQIKRTFILATNGERLEIELSKSKLFMMLIGAIGFVAVGLWFAISPPTITNSYWGNPTKIALVGYASIIFFGLCTVFILRKLSDTKAGLIIDDNGLFDNSSGLSAGQILWADIQEITVIEIHKQKLIMLHVANPQEYIDQQKSVFKRKGMQLNYKMYGTPFSITSNGLKTSFDKLLTMITDRFRKTRTNAQQSVWRYGG